MTELKIHPAADLFPMMSGEEIGELAADIAANGQREPVAVTPEDEVLDGRNRMAACKIAKVKVETRVVETDDPVAYVVSLNVKRRMLTKQQAAIAAAEAWDMERKNALGGKRAAALGRQFGCGTRYVEMARALIVGGDTGLVASVKEGRIDLTSAYEAMRELQARQEGDEEALAEAQERLANLQVELTQRQYVVDVDILPPPTAEELKITLADLKKKGLKADDGNQSAPSAEEIRKMEEWDASLKQTHEVVRRLRELPDFPEVPDGKLIAIQTAEIARLLGDASSRLLKAIPKPQKLRSVE